MMALITRTIVLCAVFTLGLSTTELLQEFARGNRDFSAAVYQELSKTEPGNFLACPISVEMVLALAGLGSKGETYVEISRGLGLPLDPATTETVFEQFTPQLRGNQLYALNTANKIFAMEGFQINKTYQEVARSVFDAGVETVNFGRNIEAAQNINSWVEQKTNNKIHQIVNPSDLSADTRMVLVNAIHFKGKWKKPFDLYDTFKRAFYINNQESRMVDMMHLTDIFNYYENKELDCKFLEMAYEGGDLSMVLVLPNQRNGLQALENYSNMLFKQQPYTKQHVRIQLPKFSMETSIQFKPILENLGIKKPFSFDADFSGISANGGNLYIDKVIQKTFINVTERGTEAAAATAGGVVTLSIPAPDRMVQVEFIADHPFLVLIQFTNRARRAPAILFAGRYQVMSVALAYFPVPDAPFTFEADHPFLFILRARGIDLFIGRYSQPELQY